MVSISIPIAFVIICVIFSQRILCSKQYEEASVGTKIRSEQYAIKTFQNQYGDTYDCVDIYKQSSLAHPLLKNHKIQMKPSSKPKMMFIEDDSSSKSKKTRRTSTTTNKHLDIIWEGLKNTCPRGTVPIRRSLFTQQKEEEQKEKGLTTRPHLQTQHHHSSDFNQNALSDVSIFAGIKTKDPPNKNYRGTFATVSVYNPKVTTDQMSGVVISVQSGGDRAFLNKVEVGWMVNPELYGDTNTRLYTSWTVDDSYSTGCYNTKCPGFIVVNREIPVDLVFNETSVIDSTQVEIDLQIFQDKATGNWWLVYGLRDAIIGYWPKEIVPRLGNGAQVVQMGGIVSAPYQSKPPMGSGRKFRKKFKSFFNQAFFAQIQFVDDTYVPFHGDNTFIDTVSNRCYITYGASYIDYKIDRFEFIFGYNFLFGGQGGDEYKCSGGPVYNE